MRLGVCINGNEKSMTFNLLAVIENSETPMSALPLTSCPITPVHTFFFSFQLPYSSIGSKTFIVKFITLLSSISSRPRNPPIAPFSEKNNGDDFASHSSTELSSQSIVSSWCLLECVSLNSNIDSMTNCVAVPSQKFCARKSIFIAIIFQHSSNSRSRTPRVRCRRTCRSSWRRGSFASEKTDFRQRSTWPARTSWCDCHEWRTTRTGSDDRSTGPAWECWSPHWTCCQQVAGSTSRAVFRGVAGTWSTRLGKRWASRSAWPWRIRSWSPWCREEQRTMAARWSSGTCCNRSPDPRKLWSRSWPAVVKSHATMSTAASSYRNLRHDSRSFHNL